MIQDKQEKVEELCSDVYQQRHAFLNVGIARICPLAFDVFIAKKDRSHLTFQILDNNGVTLIHFSSSGYHSQLLNLPLVLLSHTACSTFLISALRLVPTHMTGLVGLEEENLLVLVVGADVEDLVAGLLVGESDAFLETVELGLHSSQQVVVLDVILAVFEGF